MDKNKRWARIIIALFVFVVVLIIIHIIKTASASITNLPKIRSIDVMGNEFKSEDLRGKIVYVQFINSDRVDDIASLNAVYRDWKYGELVLIAVTNEPKKLLARTAFDRSYLKVLEDQDEKIATRFRSSYSDSSFYLFDQNGLLVASGKNDSGPEMRIKNDVMWMLYKKKYMISDFIPLGENIIDIEWLRDLAVLRERHFRYCVVALLNYVCYSCQSRIILDNLNEICLKGRENIQVLIILSQEYAESDIENIRSQFNINCSIITANDSLNEKWFLLNKEYYSSDLNNIIFVIDQNGTIARLAYPSCECHGDVYYFIKSNIEADNETE